MVASGGDSMDSDEDKNLVPVQILSRSRGIPIPQTEFTFALTEEESNKFRVTTTNLQGVLLEKSFIIAVSVETDEMLDTCININETIDTLGDIGVFCELVGIKESGTEYLIGCKVHARTRVGELTYENDVLKTELSLVRESLLPGEEELIADMRSLVKLLAAREESIDPAVRSKILATNDIIKIANYLAAYLPIPQEDKFNFLQYEDNLERFTLVMRNLVRILHTEEDNEIRLTGDMIPPFIRVGGRRGRRRSKQTTGLEDLDARLAIAELPKNVLERIQREHERLALLPPGSLEFQALFEYLNWIADIPWGISTYEEVDLNALLDLLSETHHGLLEVKEHILEYLTIEKITGKTCGTVMCFVGPPGTGKTSIAKQIAAVCNRKIVKIAMGGVSDEAELRGHRRTYVAARPGRIVTGLKEAATMDPLYLIDEVDKIDRRRGDPASALLELLDTEQNTEFIDRYLELPIDMSSAMFICTANELEDIPEPLKDRFELITFREYSLDERKVILEKFIVPQSRKLYNLEDKDISFTSDVLSDLSKTISVRRIEQRVRKLLRRAAVKIVVYKEESVCIDQEFLENVPRAPDDKGNLGFE
jgi:ATP-dependent Lon protease